MEIRQLEYFVSASLLGNLTRVAERHFVSQPNITIAIKKLETELGVTLFDRKKNKLVLTEEGMFFLQKIEPILIALKNSVAEMKDYRNENGGIVTLGDPTDDKFVSFFTALQAFPRDLSRDGTLSC